MESRKMVLMILFEGSKGDANIKNRHRVTVGEGEGGLTWETSTELYTSPYVNCIASGNLLHEAEPKADAVWQPTGVRWSGRWEEGFKRKGAYVYLWMIHVDVWQKPLQYCNVIILQLKKIRKHKDLPKIFLRAFYINLWNINSSY